MEQPVVNDIRDVHVRDVHLVRCVLQGNAAARTALISRLEPILRPRVRRALARHSAVGSYDVNDLLQEVLVQLLERPERILGAWNPDKGLALDAFMGLVTQRTATAILRSGRKSGWAERPCDDNELTTARYDRTPEVSFAEKEELLLVLGRLRTKLNARGVALLEAVLESPEAAERARLRFNMSASAMHTFRSRLRTLWRMETQCLHRNGDRA